MMHLDKIANEKQKKKQKAKEQKIKTKPTAYNLLSASYSKKVHREHDDTSYRPVRTCFDDDPHEWMRQNCVKNSCYLLP